METDGYLGASRDMHAADLQGLLSDSLSFLKENCYVILTKWNRRCSPVPR